MKKQLTTIIAIFSYFVLYAPQPLLPKFALLYNIGISQAGALMTATLVPLALAPLLYGYLLSTMKPSTIMKYSVFLMGLSCIAFAQSDTYHFSFIVRFLQGLFLPAALTAITTYIGAHSKPEELQQNMSLFVTGTILGGLFGRVLSGFFATYLSWQLFYYGLAIILLVLAFLIPKDTNEVKVKYAQLHINSIISVFKIENVAKIYTGVFCIFFSFVAILNYLPFILKELLDNPNASILGLMYAGFIMGAIASLNARRLIVKLGSAKRVMAIGYCVFLLATLLLLIPNVIVIFIVLFLFCGSMFLVHSVAVSEVNKYKTSNKSILNALYVTFYYSGGVLGSYLPGLLYEYYGSRVFICSLLIVSGIGYIFITRTHNNMQ